MKLYSIEGNIGSGKSTIIAALKKNENENFIFLPEPVDIWNEITDTSGVTILEKYYQDSKRYAFSFQMMAYITRLNQLKNIIANSNENAIIITERCLYTDSEIFAKMLYDTGKIEHIEYSIYKRWFDEFAEISKLSGIIYIKTTPDVCAQRITLRNRKGETIPIDYLEMCHQYHETWIIKNIPVIGNPPVLIVNGNEKDNQETIVQSIYTFIR